MDIGNSIERGFTVFFAWIPALLGALAILVIGYFVAKFVGKLVTRARWSAPDSTGRSTPARAERTSRR
jgi:hypothetical protein